MSAALQRPAAGHAAPPPAQFLGMARQFRAKIEAVDTAAQAAMEGITGQLRLLVARRQFLSASGAAKLGEMWRRTVPETGRLALDIRTAAQSLHIRELRLTASRTRDFDWGDRGAREPGIAILIVRVRSDVHGYKSNCLHIATVSLHALARRYQRGLDNCDDAVLADIRVVADGSAEIGPDQNVDFVFPTPGGCWSGYTMTLWGEDEDGPPVQILAVRTFLPDN